MVIPDGCLGFRSIEPDNIAKVSENCMIGFMHHDTIEMEAGFANPEDRPLLLRQLPQNKRTPFKKSSKESVSV